MLVENLGRGTRLVRSVFTNGLAATRVAVQAKRLGAKQKLLEFGGLVALIRKQPPAVVLEIGTLHGGTLWAWSRVAKDDAVIISVDLPGGAFGGGYDEADADRLHRYARSAQTVHLIRADSHDPKTLERVVDVLGHRRIDVLFIDGDHTYEGVRQDFEAFSPLVKPGGLIVFHDIALHDDPACEVDRLWRSLVDTRPHREFVAGHQWGTSDRRWGGIGVLVQTAQDSVSLTKPQ